MGISPRHPESEAWFTPERIVLVVLAAVTAIVFYLCYRMIEPFVPALAWALAIAVVSHPLHAWLQRHIRHASLVAGLMVGIVALTILAPAVLLVQHATNDAIAASETVKDFFSDGGLQDALGRNEALARASDWLGQRINVRSQFEHVADTILGNAKGLFTGSIQAVTGLLITLFLLFYFFRDRDAILHALRTSAPLSPREADRLFANVGDTINAIVYGTLLIALVQGGLGGLMFLALGLPSPVMWGMVMALLSILPLFGAALVWMPAALYLLLVEGSWEKALALAAWGSIVIGLVDNLLYPIFVKNRLRMHTVPVFIAVLGGLITFGTAGIVLGPVVLAIAAALAGVWQRRMAGGEAVENVPDAAAATPSGTRDAEARQATSSHQRK